MSIRFKFEKPENVMRSDDVVTPEPMGTGHAIPEITPAAEHLALSPVQLR